LFAWYFSVSPTQKIAKTPVILSILFTAYCNTQNNDWHLLGKYLINICWMNACMLHEENKCHLEIVALGGCGPSCSDNTIVAQKYFGISSFMIDFQVSLKVT
jgi:hypothetical protein